MTYFLALILIVSCLVYYREKGLFFASLIFLWLMFAGSYGHADYFLSMQSYNNINGKTIGIEDPLWFILRKVLYRTGMSYEIFIGAVSCACLLLIAKTILDFTSNVNYVIALYIIAPFALDIVQFNNFVAMTLVVYSTRYLIKGNIHIIRFVLILITAIGICGYTIIYLVFLCIPFLSIRKCMIIAIAGNAFLLLSPIIFYEFAIRFIRAEKIDVYFKHEINFSTVWVLIAFVLLGVGISAFFYYKVMKKSKSQYVINKSVFLPIHIGEMIVKANILMLLTISVQTYSLEGARMYRNIFILNYILASLVRTRKDYKLNSVVARIATLVLPILYSVLYVYIWNKNSVLIPIFEYNTLFNALF